jgi:hypothetical protein
VESDGDSSTLFGIRFLIIEDEVMQAWQVADVVRNLGRAFRNPA